MARLRKEIDKTTKEIDRLGNSAPKLAMDKSGVWSDYANKSTNIDANFTGAPKYTSAQDAATYADQMRQAMGLGKPDDTRDATRTAVMGQLDREAYRTSSADAARNASTGGGSGAAAALASRRGMDLAQSRAGAEASLQNDFATRADQYRNMMMGYGMQNADQRSQYGMNQSDMANKFGLQKAGMQSDAQANAGQFLGQQDFDRTSSLYEANQLLPWQAKLGIAQGKLAGQQAKLANRQAIGSGIANTVIQTVGKVAGGMMGGG